MTDGLSMSVSVCSMVRSDMGLLVVALDSRSDRMHRNLGNIFSHLKYENAVSSETIRGGKGAR